MSGVIYLMRDKGELVAMSEHAYDTEDLLQGYLADHPDLLAGDQINNVEPRRWLLISREMGLPSEEGGGDRWSADHLFLDQDAIPTIVEVKRSTDNCARREVVAQMLDYAANGVMYWPLDRLRATFEANCQTRGHDPEATLLESLDLRIDTEEFWQRAITNLQAGKVRLIFVADTIPAELRRIVEFLNEQMNPAEVFAVEVKQHVADDLVAFVPRLIGQTAQAQRTESVGVRTSRKWNETLFFEELQTQSREAVDPARAILDWAKGHMPSIYWGRGKIYGTFIPGLRHKGRWHQVVGISTDGSIEVQFQYMKRKPPFDEESKRRELLKLLNDIPGIDVPADTVTGRRP